MIKYLIGSILTLTTAANYALAQSQEALLGQLITFGLAQERERLQRNNYIGLFIFAAIAILIYIYIKRQNIKTCPTCKEKVKKSALRCKHCGIDFS